jgi:benzoyl-CoA reductase/2-hydroxyglutaryl-CoA dehydratase subunit BcrC/BadD/HgdB
MQARNQLEFIDLRKKSTEGYNLGIGKLLDLAATYVFDAEKAFAAGHKVTWCSGVWESPLIYACDTIPISHTELGRLSNSKALLIAEDYYQIPKDMCTMVGVLLGEWYLRKDRVNRLLGFNGDCENFNMAWELLKEEGFQVHRIEQAYVSHDTPRETFENRVHFLVEQLYEAARWLNGGEELDESKLVQEISRKNRILKKVVHIHDLRVQNPLFMRSLETMYMIVGAQHYFGKPEEYEEAIDLILAGLLADNYHPEEKFVPLVWTGGRGQEFGIYQAIDDFGGAILGHVLPSPISNLYDETIPPVEALARFVLGTGETSGSITQYAEIVKKQIDKCQGRGVLNYSYVGCSLAGVQSEYVREYLHQFDIPMLVFDGNFQVGPPSGQLVTRVKAFLEMLS